MPINQQVPRTSITAWSGALPGYQCWSQQVEMRVSLESQERTLVLSGALSQIAEGRLKRIRFWDPQPAQREDEGGEDGDGRPQAKRQRHQETDRENGLALTPAPGGSTTCDQSGQVPDNRRGRETQAQDVGQNGARSKKMKASTAQQKVSFASTDIWLKETTSRGPTRDLSISKCGPGGTLPGTRRLEELALRTQRSGLISWLQRAQRDRKSDHASKRVEEREGVGGDRGEGGGDESKSGNERGKEEEEE